MILVVVTTTAVVLLFRHWYPFDGPIYHLSNEAEDDFFQETQSSQLPLDTTIIVLVVDEDIEPDSLALLVQKVASYHPRVIGVDFDIHSTSVKRYKLPDSVTVVLASAYDSNDSTEYPTNLFDGRVEYGTVNGNSYYWAPTKEREPLRFAETVLKSFSTNSYKAYRARRYKDELIRYRDASTFISFDPAQIDYFGDRFANKIVLFGHFGSKYHSHDYLSPSQLDDKDIHYTPLGEQFGSLIVYCEIYTLLGHFIAQSSVFFDDLAIVLIAIFISLILFSIAHLNKKLLLVLAILLVVVFIFCLNLLTFIEGVKLNTEFDYQSYCYSAIVSAFFSFALTLK